MLPYMNAVYALVVPAGRRGRLQSCRTRGKVIARETCVSYGSLQWEECIIGPLLGMTMIFDYICTV